MHRTNTLRILIAAFCTLMISPALADRCDDARSRWGACARNACGVYVDRADNGWAFNRCARGHCGTHPDSLAVCRFNAVPNGTAQ